MWGFLASLLSKAVSALFGEWSRDRANVKKGEMKAKLDTHEANDAHRKKAADVDRVVLGDEPSDWLSRVKRDAGFRD